MIHATARRRAIAGPMFKNERAAVLPFQFEFETIAHHSKLARIRNRQLQERWDVEFRHEQRMPLDQRLKIR